MEAMLRDIKNTAQKGAISIGGMAISVYDSAGAMKDLTGIMADIEVATKGMTTAQRDAALSSVFQQESLRGANILLSAGTESVRDFEKALHSSSGAAQEASRIAEDSLGGSFRSLGSAVEGLMLSFEDELNPILTSVANYLSDLAKQFSKLDEDTRKTILVVGAFAAAIGPVILGLGLLAGSVNAVIGILPVLAKGIVLLTGPIGITAAAIAGLAFVWFKWGDDIKRITSDVRDWLAATWENIKTSTLTAWESVKTNTLTAWENIKTGVVEKVASLKDTLFEQAKSIVDGLWQGFLAKKDELVANISAWIKEVIPDPIAKLLKIASPSKVMIEFGEMVAVGLARGIEDKTSKVISSAEKLANVIKDVSNSMLNELSISMQLTEKSFRLMEMQLQGTASETELLSLKQVQLTKQFQIAKENVLVLEEAHRNMAGAQGENSLAAQELMLQLLDAKITQEDLAQKIMETTNTLNEQRAEFSKPITVAAPVFMDSGFGAGGGGNSGSGSGSGNTPTDVINWPSINDVLNDPSTPQAVIDAIESTRKMQGLASGGLFKKQTTGLFNLAETAAARPEIVSPVRIMADTFRGVLRNEMPTMSSGYGGGLVVNGPLVHVDKVSSDMDVDRIGDMIVRKLQRKGVFA